MPVPITSTKWNVGSQGSIQVTPLRPSVEQEEALYLLWEVVFQRIPGIEDTEKGFLIIPFFLKKQTKQNKQQRSKILLHTCFQRGQRDGSNIPTHCIDYRKCSQPLHRNYIGILGGQVW